MPRKKRSSWGSVTKLATNKWRIRWWQDGRRHTEIVNGTRRQADDRLAAIRVQVGSEPQSLVTVGTVYETRWLPDARARLRRRTLANVLSLWRRHVAPRWGGVPAAAVRATDIQDWLLGIPKDSAPKALSVLRGVLREAVMAEVIDRSPAEIRFRMPDGATKKFSHEVIRSADVGDYAAAVRGTPVEAMFLLSACAGLRVGESLGPRAGEVTREEVPDGGGAVTFAAIPVRRQVDDYGRVVEEGGRERLKNDHSERWAVMPEPWASRLLEIQRERIEAGDAFLTSDGAGGPLGKVAARRLWHSACEAAGLQRIDLRNLRPTFATSMHFGRGMSSEDIARLLGHRRPTITFAVYERPDKDDLVSAVARSLS